MRNANPGSNMSNGCGLGCIAAFFPLIGLVAVFLWVWATKEGEARSDWLRGLFIGWAIVTVVLLVAVMSQR